MNREHFYAPDLDNGDASYEAQQLRITSDVEGANLVSSIIVDDEKRRHAPVLDLDVPHRVVPSTTPGHAHLYLDIEIPWDKYAAFLIAGEEAGIFQRGFVELSLERGATFVRKEGVKKVLPT